MFRRTKIVATLGPACDRNDHLEKMVKAGVNVLRVNFSHGTSEEHIKRVKQVRELSKKFNIPLGILADLQGPKIRIECFENGSVHLTEGERFILDADYPSDKGNTERVSIAYKALMHDLKMGDTLLLDDGRIALWVEKIENSEIICRVVIGGILSDRKGINLQGGGLSAPALTEKDKTDIVTAAGFNADYIAVSFVKNAGDIHEARQLFEKAGGSGAVVAKIERSEALDNIDEIIDATDIIMVARGDLGVEIGDAALPPAQKRLISQAIHKNKAVITATQMMESMIENPIPTRAEVFDVANAVIDGTDAVMLSAETATGKFPDKTIAAMDRICREVEKRPQVKQSNHRIDSRFQRVDEAIALGGMYIANHLNVRAIVSLTHSGSTPIWMSRISSGIPIFALTPNQDTYTKLTPYRGVQPIMFTLPERSQYGEVNRMIIELLKEKNIVSNGDLVILAKGDYQNIEDGTNALKIVEVGD
ncbi:MAG: pyruvate kinase [Pseudomonadales bacterium]|nr:pyruvate kinase [Pseudomonadales bacterium]